MYTGNVWGIALLIAGFLAALIGFQLLMGALVPRWTDEAVRSLRERAGLSALLGLGGLAGVVVAVVVLAQFGGPGKFLAGLAAIAAWFPAVAGLGAVSRFVGERMPSSAAAGGPWRATLRGGVTVALAAVVPVVGWFLVLPLATAMGLGAFAAAALASSRKPVASPVVPNDGAGA